MTGVTLLLCALLLVSEAPSAQAQLRLNFYRGKCRNRRIDVEAVVRKSITQSFNQDSSLPGGIARIFFHDAFVHVSVHTTLLRKALPCLLSTLHLQETSHFA